MSCSNRMDGLLREWRTWRRCSPLGRGRCPPARRQTPRNRTVPAAGRAAMVLSEAERRVAAAVLEGVVLAAALAVLS